MSYFGKKSDLSISRQVACLKSKYPKFVTTSNHLRLKTTGILQPTARSVDYTIEVKYRLGTRPEVSVLKPELEKNFNNEKIPHVYPGKKLCLYLPGADQFNHSDFLALSILPWISLWLYYYELWHVTGEWYGGGLHPSKK